MDICARGFSTAKASKATAVIATAIKPFSCTASSHRRAGFYRSDSRQQPDSESGEGRRSRGAGQTVDRHHRQSRHTEAAEADEQVEVD